MGKSGADGVVGEDFVEGVAGGEEAVADGEEGVEAGVQPGERGDPAGEVIAPGGALVVRDVETAAETAERAGAAVEALGELVRGEAIVELHAGDAGALGDPEAVLGVGGDVFDAVAGQTVGALDAGEQTAVGGEQGEAFVEKSEGEAAVGEEGGGGRGIGGEKIDVGGWQGNEGRVGAAPADGAGAGEEERAAVGFVARGEDAEVGLGGMGGVGRGEGRKGNWLEAVGGELGGTVGAEAGVEATLLPPEAGDADVEGPALRRAVGTEKQKADGAGEIHAIGRGEGVE